MTIPQIKKANRKINKTIGLNRIETRFLLNFVLEEGNALLEKLFKNVERPSAININNCHQNKAIYERKLGILKRKLERLDKTFYK